MKRDHLHTVRHVPKDSLERIVMDTDASAVILQLEPILDGEVSISQRRN